MAASENGNRCHKCFSVYCNGQIDSCPIKANYSKASACISCGGIKGYDTLARFAENDTYIRCYWCRNILKKENFYNIHPHKCRRKPEHYDKYFCVCSSKEMVSGIEHYNCALFEENNVPIN